MRKIRMITVCLLILLTVKSAAQDDITVKEVESIRYKSEILVVRELKGLLNNINTNTDIKEVSDMINNSHSGSRNRIFLNSKIIVEDDINPNFHSAANTRDIDIDKYLRDFDLLYKKGDMPSVVFNDIKISNLKKKDAYYVNVYYTSFFRNPNKTNDTAYTINNRMAEMRFKKENNTWTPYIARLGFFNPSDTINDVLNNVTFKTTSDLPLQLQSADSITAAQARKSIDEEIKENARRQLIEEDRVQTQAFSGLINQGDAALARNDFPEALKLYKEARELRPYDPLPQSKISNANRERERATISSDQLFSDFIKKAQLAEKKREYENSAILYNKAIEQKPAERSKYEQNIAIVTNKFRVISEQEEKYKAGLYKEALSSYNAVIKKDKTNSDYFLGRAKCYDKLGEYKKALSDYNQAYELDRFNLEAIEKRADLYKRNNEPFKALTDYKTYLTISKENLRVYEEMSDLRIKINNNIEEAIRDLNDGLAFDPRAAQLYLKKGLLLVQKNDIRNADLNFSTVIKLDSNHAFAYYNRGKCKLHFNNIPNAALDFQSAREKGLDSVYIKKIETYAEPLFERAAAKFSANIKDSAITLIDFAISVNPYKSTYRFTRGNYYFSLKNYNEAIKSYDDALNLDNKYTDAYYNRGTAYYNLNNYTASIENLKSVLKLNPQYFLAQKGLGDAYYALQDYNSSGNYYANSLQTINSLKSATDPATMAEIFNSMGKSYFNVTDYERAMTAFKSAVRKNPNLAEAYFNKGLTYYKTGALSDAIADMSKAVSIENNHFHWNYYLAKAQQDKKDYTSAVAAYTRCIA
ncbi:MAG: tetratricopeptide repeat protein, partial [Chitinophagaceae bacterium]|nr:tetratricopeptide repeat protein [Chitinophagaceae bacterium]